VRETISRAEHGSQRALISLCGGGLWRMMKSLHACNTHARTPPNRTKTENALLLLLKRRSLSWRRNTIRPITHHKGTCSNNVWRLPCTVARLSRLRSWVDWKGGLRKSVAINVIKSPSIVIERVECCYSPSLRSYGVTVTLAETWSKIRGTGSAR